jgi:hypothetical protein
MTKYYIETGAHTIILMAKTPRAAADAAVERWKTLVDFSPHKMIRVSEVGFENRHDPPISNPDHAEDTVYLTEDFGLTARIKKKKGKF